MTSQDGSRDDGIPGEGAIYVIADDALLTDMEEESVGLSVLLGRYFGIRGAMRHLVPQLREGITHAAMVARLCDLYDVSPQEAAADIDRVLPELIAAGLVKRVAPA